MNRLDQTFHWLKRSGKKALIGYVTAGFPTKAGFYLSPFESLEDMRIRQVR